MDWLRVATDLASHPKCTKLGMVLGVDRPHSFLVDMWGWAARYHQDGDLSDCEPLDIAVGCRWTGDPEKLLDALIQCRLLDQDADVLLIHDWEEHQGKIIEQKQAACQRSRAWRERMRIEREAKRERMRTPRIRTPLQTNKHTNETDEHTPPSSPQSEFEDWYRAYPKKVDRKSAEKAWQKLTNAKRGECVERTPGWLQRMKDRNTDLVYYPNPATFLNGERWTDDVPPPANVSSPQPSADDANRENYILTQARQYHREPRYHDWLTAYTSRQTDDGYEAWTHASQ